MNLINWDAEAVTEGLREANLARPNVLSHMKSLLDDYSGIVREIDDYDLLAGAWIDSFIHNVYTSWIEVLAGNVSSSKTEIPTIKTLDEAQKMATQESWHCHLQSMILNVLYDSKPIGNKISQDLSYRSSIYDHNLFRVKSICKNSFFNALTSNSNVLMSGIYLNTGRMAFYKEIMALRKWTSFCSFDVPYQDIEPTNWPWRFEAASNVTISDSFLGLIKSLLPLYLPHEILEGLNRRTNELRSLSITRPKVVFTQGSLHGNPSMRILMMDWRKSGTKLVCHQHGGGYGLEKNLTVENYEKKVSEHFFSWGWGCNEKISHLSPAFPKHIYSERRKRSLSIFLNCLDLPKVPYRLVHFPIGNLADEMLQETLSFLNLLPQDKNIIINPYPTDYGRGALNMMKTAAPCAKINTRKGIERYLDAGIVVHNYLGTSWLETIGLNIPTICFFNPNIYVYREEAKKYMDKLFSVGILHYSGVEAARFVNSIGIDLNGWWNSYNVQFARNEFSERYAKFSPNWDTQWEENIQRFC